MWSATGLLGFLNLAKREEIMNVMTKESVDFIPLASYLSKLLDVFWNERKYIALINAGVNK